MAVLSSFFSWIILQIIILEEKDFTVYFSRKM